MVDEVKEGVEQSRSYDSPVRRARAMETEQRILDAAAAGFAADGYVRTSMAAIAERAGIAPRTVYKVFGTKVELLSRLVDVAMAGDQEGVPVMGRPAASAAFEGSTGAERIAAFASAVRLIMERAGEAFRTAAQAAIAEPAAAALWAEGQRLRQQDATSFVAALAAAGLLRSDRTKAEAMSSVWVLASPETYLQLTDGLGQTLDAYERWLTRSLTDALLP